MKILSAGSIRDLDAYTIANEPIESIDLMERAASVFCRWFVHNFDRNKPIIIFCGIGNNGGDGLCIGRLLTSKAYQCSIFVTRYSQESSEDFKINEHRLAQNKIIPVHEILSEDDFPEIHSEHIIIDALWGSGLSRPITGFAEKLIRLINDRSCCTVSVDIPSGLFADKRSNSICIQAHYTFSFEAPRLSFMYPENEKFVGEYAFGSIGLSEERMAKTDSDYHYISKDDVSCLLVRRNRFGHKGTYGHALIIAGGKGKEGAAYLASLAALKAGSGLVSLMSPGINHAKPSYRSPEIMYEPPFDNGFINDEQAPKYDSYAIGPGIGTGAAVLEEFRTFLLAKRKKPLVLDADALNIIAENPGLWVHIPAGSILTPHPGEFKRLVASLSIAPGDDYEMHKIQLELSARFKIYIILKRANTLISTPEGISYFNSTGNPGMATAGSGDVLTGILAAFMAKGYNPLDSCLVGVYLHGLAGDIAAIRKGEESMTSMDIIEFIGPAIKAIQE